MISCTTSADVFRCPTKWELWRQIMALLPRGRAWQTHEDGGPERVSTGVNSQVGTFQTAVTPLGGEPVVERLSVLEQYWAAYAELLDYFHQRACALIEEFFCATTVEQRDEWGIDYGFPDACEPWTRLCDKVAARGGATCAYLVEVAAARGWLVTCGDCGSGCGDRAGCARAGCAIAGGCAHNTIFITIDLASSPAWVAPLVTGARAGCARAGCATAAPCLPTADPLVCLIERVKPAHVRAVYLFV